MRSFYAYIYKNLIWIYLCIVVCFAYTTLMDSIPNHVYLEKGQKISLSQKIPVEWSVCNRQTQAMADIGLNTYESVKERMRATDNSNLSVGSHSMICYLFGIFPIKEVEVSVVETTKIYASGHVIGIYGRTKGVFVLGSSPIEQGDGSYVQPTENIIFPGDYILAVNGKSIITKKQLVNAIKENGAEPLVLTINRREEIIPVSVQAVRAKAPGDDNLAYMLGVWVKDDMAGIGTMTYYDMQGAFGALGHGIGDGETGELLKMAHGYLYEADVLGVKKGKRGEPGELQGVVFYGKENKIGTVLSNTDIGIYGKLNVNCINKRETEDTVYPLGYKQDVKVGEAFILSDASGETATYHIVIDSFDYSPTDRNKGIRFHVDDKELLELTGGIVQGLSGSPIIQDGKLIGGVTHVLINDPTKGYGIFAETMLSDKK